MSGPPYPHPSPPPAPIGQFAIGITPIGTIPSFDYWQTVISQYANSPILTQLIVNMAQYIDPTQLLDSFHDLIWDIDTAQGYGLDLLGRIIGVTRTINIPGSITYFGFEEGGVGAYVGFNQEAFFSGSPLSTNFQLSDTSYRTLLFAKALSNISNGTIPAINQLLLNLFKGRGNTYVIDNLNMTMVYQFNFVLTSVENLILQQSGVLPKPVGVSATVVHF